MGVRFQCPHGHKLHVKAELAGKRGICPECGAKFVVPSFSGGRAAEDNGELAANAAPPPLPAAQAATATAESATAPPMAWYVRPATGGQFGPATTEVFRQWIAEGRVAADSWIWRTGWADWKPGGEAVAMTAEAAVPRPSAASASPAKVAVPTATTPIPVTLIPATPIAAVETFSEEGDEEEDVVAAFNFAPEVAGTAPVMEHGTSELRRLELQRRMRRVRIVSAVFGVVMLVTLVALVVVLSR